MCQALLEIRLWMWPGIGMVWYNRLLTDVLCGPHGITKDNLCACALVGFIYC